MSALIPLALLALVLVHLFGVPRRIDEWRQRRRILRAIHGPTAAVPAGAREHEPLDLTNLTRAAQVVELESWFSRCPTCGGPLRGFGDTCPKPGCLAADLDLEAGIDRRSET